MEQALLMAFVYFLVSYLDPYILSWQALTRPIVLAPIAGLVLGDFETGIKMGAALESIFMGVSAIGGSIPADPASATVIAVAYAISSGGDMETSLAIAYPVGTIMQYSMLVFAPIMAVMPSYWEKLASKGNIKSFKIQTVLFSAAMPLFQALVMYFAVSSGVELLFYLMSMLPPFVTAGIAASSGMAIAVGLAILTAMIWSNEIGYFFFVGFAMVKYLNLNTLAIAIFGAAIAIYTFINDKKVMDLKLSMNSKNDDKEDFF